MHAGRVTPIDKLPDDVLLVIFDFYVNDSEDLNRNLPIKDDVEAWQLLVHVCHRWRSVVFGSPRRLNFQLVCTHKTLVLKILDIWPAFHLVVHCNGNHPISRVGRKNTVAALKHRGRICKINIELNEEVRWVQVLAVMQAPFH